MPTRVPDPSRDHERWRELVAANALGALDAADRVALAAHRVRCSSCAALGHDLVRAAMRLLDAPGSIRPPPELRQRVLAAIGIVLTRSTPWWRRRELRFGLSLAAGLAAAVWIGLATSAPSVARVELAGVGEAALAGGTATIDHARGRVELIVHDLPQLDPSHSYELWWIDAGSAHATGVFRPDASGRARRRFAAEGVLPRSAILAVTIEVRGGVPAPAGPIVLRDSRTPFRTGSAFAPYHR